MIQTDIKFPLACKAHNFPRAFRPKITAAPEDSRLGVAAYRPYNTLTAFLPNDLQRLSAPCVSMILVVKETIQHA